MSLKTDLIIFAVKEIIGTRNFNENDSLTDNSRGKKSPDWLTRTFDFAKSWFAKGWDYLMSNFASILMGGAQNIYQFDWARTDKMIWDDIEAVNKGFTEQVGRMGASKLFRETGLGMTKAAKMKYPTLDPTIIANIDEENREELKASIDSSLIAIRAGIQRNLFNICFMSGRYLLGKSPKEYVKPWSLATWVEGLVEWTEKTIPLIGGLFRGFKEQAEDDFFDMGYLITGGVQAQYAMSKAAINDSQGPQRIIKLYPNKEDKTRFTFVTGTETEIKQAVSNVMVNTAVMEDLNVGMVVQTSLDTSMKSTMGLRLITVYLNMSETGGTTLPSGKRAPQKIIEIKNVKTTVDYDKIKLHFKNLSGGAWKVTAHLDDGHQLQGFFASEAEGKSYFRPIIENICTARLVRFSVQQPHEKLTMRPQVGIFKPASFTMQIRKETTDIAKKNFITTDGKMYRVEIKSRIKLQGTKPENIDSWILNPFVETA